MQRNESPNTDDRRNGQVMTEPLSIWSNSGSIWAYFPSGEITPALSLDAELNSTLGSSVSDHSQMSRFVVVVDFVHHAGPSIGRERRD